MVYDYLISVDQEVEQIWKRPKTTTTMLYLVLRYFGTLCGVFNAAVFLSDVSKEVRIPCTLVRLSEGPR
ncbi:hypothetical protein EV401DRAFT_1973860 [Pisolithus croceorrhizus]|nr:hypothetical protein EV401DRAFT_1973860 [Pisolithus croceorrhizus]